MKLFFLHSVSSDCSIYSKIISQHEVFQYYLKNGNLEDYRGVECVKNNEKRFYLKIQNDNNYIKFFHANTIGEKLYNWIISLNFLYYYTYKFIIKNKYTHLFIRRSSYTDYNLLFFLKRLKEKGIVILYEIPTYPYDLELRKKSLLTQLEKKCRLNLYKYVDTIVTPSNAKAIFGIPTIYTINGINVNKTKPRKITLLENRKIEINLLAVAGLSEWHGYDRLISGLAEYYKKNGDRDIVFHLVGGDENNPIRLGYEAIVEKNHLQNHVVFYGNKQGDDLDEIYSKCSIGVASLGMHRINIYLASTLKTREYAAKGLPMITSCKIDVFPDDYKYILRIPEDESPINMYDVIKFFDSIYKANSDFEKVNKTIREFALKTCDIKKTMQPIIKYINAGKN